MAAESFDRRHLKRREPGVYHGIDFIEDFYGENRIMEGDYFKVLKWEKEEDRGKLILGQKVDLTLLRENPEAVLYFSTEYTRFPRRDRAQENTWGPSLVRERYFIGPLQEYASARGKIQARPVQRRQYDDSGWLTEPELVATVLPSEMIIGDCITLFGGAHAGIGISGEITEATLVLDPQPVKIR